MPKINTIARDYRDKGVVVLALNLQESQSKVQTYQNMYPEVLMLMDTYGATYSRYAQNGYIPLNYVLDHDVDQKIDYWMEGYNDATIKNRINGLLADVTANLDPDAASYKVGTTLGFDLTVTNWEPASRFVYMSVDVKQPSGTWQTIGFTSLNLSAGETRLMRYDLPIPNWAATGDYVMRVRLGMPPSDLWNSDTFDFEITP